MAVAEERTWAPPLGAPAEVPKPVDKTAFADAMDLPEEGMNFSEFTTNGSWDVYDVPRAIFEESSEVLGQEFPYPCDE